MEPGARGIDQEGVALGKLKGGGRAWKALA